MRWLKSFGCSFIFGSDLKDDGGHDLCLKPSQQTWPAHLARHLNLEYACYAHAGIGNLQILERILRQLTQKYNDFYVIGWTWSNRFDYRDYNSNEQSSNFPWKTLRPMQDSELSTMYFRDLNSEYQDKLATLIYIKTAVDALTQNGIPFVMTVMDKILFDQTWHAGPAINYLQDYVKPHITWFEDTNFLEWSRLKGFEESDNWHPLEQAHQHAGQYMINQIDRQQKVM